MSEPLDPDSLAQLIRDSDERPVMTGRQDTDATTAIARGLKEYLTSLTWQASGGREIRVQNVFSSWAEAENSAKYPSLAINVNSTGTYGDSSLTPSTKRPTLVDGSSVVKACELELLLEIGIWASDKKERSLVVAALETALNPVEWMYGFRLTLPFYFNTLAKYEPRNIRYEDEEEEAMRRFRKAVLSVQATLSVQRKVQIPLSVPRPRSTVSEDAATDSAWYTVSR